jgi:16S rRNA (cytosine1402-N4)-methyltransferase
MNAITMTKRARQKKAGFHLRASAGHIEDMTRKFTPVRGRLHSRREEGADVREQKREHVSVMLKEAVDALAPKAGEVVVDATYGRGGHSKALKASAKITLLSIDADPRAGTGVIEGNFGDLAQILQSQGVKKADKFLFDLGWNTTQLSSGRGFSFLYDEPLNMSYGDTPRSGFTATEALNEWSEKTLADVFFGYGEERYARRIAKAVVERRETKLFETTLELVEVVRDSVPAAYRRGRIHPATKTFQALRMAVNDELGALKSGLRSAWAHLSCGGRIAVITFHSIEDRAVKQYFAELKKEGKGALLSKKPLVPGATETKNNPASRSAKMRVIEKICE